MSDISRIAKFKIAYEQDKVDNFKAGLKVGVDINGRVAQVLSKDQYIVTLRGMNLIAQSDIPMRKGSKFKARIVDTQPKLTLKIINSSDPQNELADKLGIKGEGKTLFAEMAASKIPLTRKNFDRINSVVEKFARHPDLGGNYQEIARAVVRLERQGIPVNADTISRQLTAMKGDFDVSQLLGKLSILCENQDENPTKNTRSLLAGIAGKFTPEMLRNNLPAMVTVLGLMHESDLKNLLTKGKLSKTMNLKWAILKLLEDSPEFFNRALPMLKDLEAMQLRNVPENRSQDGDTYYLQVPVYYEENWEKVDLFLHQENSKDGRLDKDNVSIRINLNTKYLGELSVYTDIRNGGINIGFYFSAESIAEYVRPYLQDLEDVISAIGYDVRSITVSVLPDQPERMDGKSQPAESIYSPDKMDSLNLFV